MRMLNKIKRKRKKEYSKDIDKKWIKVKKNPKYLSEDDLEEEKEEEEDEQDRHKKMKMHNDDDIRSFSNHKLSVSHNSIDSDKTNDEEIIDSST